MKDLTDKTIPILTELKTLVSLRDKKIEEQQANVEQYKQVADHATEEKEKERKERIDTIFMYESRIKGKLIVIINTANWIKPHFKQSNIFHLERTLSGKIISLLWTHKISFRVILFNKLESSISYLNLR